MEKNGEDLMVSVEGRGSLVTVEGFSDLLREPLLPHQDLGVIQCVAMTGGRVVFRNAELRCFPSVCSRKLVPSILVVLPMYSWSHSLHLMLYTIPTLFLFLGLVLGVYQQGP